MREMLSSSEEGADEKSRGEVLHSQGGEMMNSLGGKMCTSTRGKML